jgi:hypothetical protein
VRNNWFENTVTGFDNRTTTGSVFCGNTGAVDAPWRSAC